MSSESPYPKVLLLPGVGGDIVPVNAGEQGRGAVGGED